MHAGRNRAVARLRQGCVGHLRRVVRVGRQTDDGDAGLGKLRKYGPHAEARRAVHERHERRVQREPKGIAILAVADLVPVHDVLENLNSAIGVHNRLAIPDANRGLCGILKPGARNGRQDAQSGHGRDASKESPVQLGTRARVQPGQASEAARGKPRGTRTRKRAVEPAQRVGCGRVDCTERNLDPRNVRTVDLRPIAECRGTVRHHGAFEHVAVAQLHIRKRRNRRRVVEARVGESERLGKRDRVQNAAHKAQLGIVHFCDGKGGWFFFKKKAEREGRPHACVQTTLPLSSSA